LLEGAAKRLAQQRRQVAARRRPTGCSGRAAGEDAVRGLQTRQNNNNHVQLAVPAQNARRARGYKGKTYSGLKIDNRYGH
jgi:hypothetical protein